MQSTECGGRSCGRRQRQPEGREIVGAKWVHKRKDEQDGSVRHNPNWFLEIVDVEAAFLEGDMEKTVHIEWPAGMAHLRFIAEDEQENHCIEQLISMCGNSVAALIHFRPFKKHLLEALDMKQSLADPRAFFKVFEDKVALVAVRDVDDNAIAGAPHWNKWFEDGVKKRFGMTELGALKKCSGAWCEWKTDENGEPRVVAAMPKLVRQTIECAKKAIGHELKGSSAPATPGTCLEKNPEDEEAIMETEQRSVVGKSSCLVAKLCRL